MTLQNKKIFVCNVATQPALHNSLTLSSDVYKAASGKMKAGKGVGRLLKKMKPQEVARMVVPLGRATEMRSRVEVRAISNASDWRTKRFVDPVSLHAIFI